MTLDLQKWAPSLTAYVKWLAIQNKTAAKQWSNRLKSSQSDQTESAVAEAVMWDYIVSRCESVRLADLPGQGGVDFEFSVNGKQFCVEVTNISIAAATNASRMPDQDSSNGYFSLLTQRIRQKVRNKLTQSRKQTAHPLLVAVTTLHQNASCLCVNRSAVEFAMSSPPKITMRFNPQKGESEGEPYQSTDLSQSVFLSPTLLLGPDGEQIVQAKYQPISGFLLGGLGLEPQNVHVFGALNPEAAHPFDPPLLPDIPFCSFKRWPVSTSIEFDWTITEEEERTRHQEAAEKRLRAAGFGNMVDEVKREAREASANDSQ